MSAGTEPHELEALLETFYREAAGCPCPREADLAAHAADALSGDARADFEAHLRGCADCAADLAQLAVVKQQWEAAPETAPSRLREWLFPNGRPTQWLVASLAIGAAFALAFPLLDHAGRLRPKGAGEGAFLLDVAVQREGGAFRARPGTTLKTGDRLGFFYSSEVPGHLAILYADEARHVERVFPSNEERSAPVVPGRDVRVPDGALLVDGRGCEWVIGFFSERALAASETLDAASAMLSARSGCELGPSPLPGVEARVLEVLR